MTHSARVMKPVKPIPQNEQPRKGRIMVRLCPRVFGLIGCMLLAPAIAYGQVDVLQGDWTLTTLVPDGEYGVFTIDPTGSAGFPTTIRHSLEGQDFTFEAEHRGLAQLQEGFVFAYAGAGTASAVEANSYRVLSNVVATGVVSPASTVCAGVWLEKQTYTKSLRSLDVVDVTSAFVLMRDDFVPPELPGYVAEDIEGEWEIVLGDDTLVLSWTGLVTLNIDGTLIGLLGLSDIIEERAAPIAGLYVASEDGVFEFEYATVVEIPVVGVKTVTIYATGQLSEDNTQITGTWTLTVESGDEAAAKTQVTQEQLVERRTYSGEFNMNRVRTSAVPFWMNMN